MESITNYLPYIQIILSVLIVAVVLLQKSDASAGGVFGGADNWNAGFHTRRGFEKFTFIATIILASIFAIISLVALLLK